MELFILSEISIIGGSFQFQYIFFLFCTTEEK